MKSRFLTLIPSLGNCPGALIESAGGRIVGRIVLDRLTQKALHESKTRADWDALRASFYVNHPQKVVGDVDFVSTDGQRFLTAEECLSHELKTRFNVATLDELTALVAGELKVELPKPTDAAEIGRLRMELAAAQQDKEQLSRDLASAQAALETESELRTVTEDYYKQLCAFLEGTPPEPYTLHVKADAERIMARLKAAPIDEDGGPVNLPPEGYEKTTVWTGEVKLPAPKADPMADPDAAKTARLRKLTLVQGATDLLIDNTAGMTAAQLCEALLCTREELDAIIEENPGAFLKKKNHRIYDATSVT